MLIKAKTIKGYKLNSLDGEVGSVKEFYFDDKFWTIRYLVADTGGWLTGKQVLISPYVLKSVNMEEKLIAISLTKKQIENSPLLDSHKPVSKQFEAEYHEYFGPPMYWGGFSMWGNTDFIEHDQEKWKETQIEKESWDPNLRSTHDVSGHIIKAADGEIGHVVDFIIDEETWAIRYLIIDTNNWWPGKKVLVSTKWIERISWAEFKVFVNLTKENIKLSPEFDEDALLTLNYENELHHHYNRQGYWVDKPLVKEYIQ